MVTVNKITAKNTGTADMELKGLTGDTKPTGEFSGFKIAENSVFLELDTLDLYYYNSGSWTKAGG